MSSSKELKALTNALAGQEVPQELLKKIADDISQLDGIRRIDVCKYGICLDRFVEGDTWWQDLDRLNSIPGAKLRELKVFPWGIIEQDLSHIKMEIDFTELTQVLQK